MIIYHQRWKSPPKAAGRFNLNALHKASGGRDAKRPKAWLATKQAQELIDELRQDSAFGEDVIKITKGGITPGTFAHELLAIEYAGWISPRFSTSTSRLKRRYIR
ncbi:KilA-N domain-containing protein [Klebsiella sp. NPDC088457]